jgi:hypothetical protein
VQFSRYAFFQSFVIKTTPADYILKSNKNVTCMQELDTNVEKNIDSLMSVLRQSVLNICKNIDHQGLDYQSAGDFTSQIKATVLSFGCRLVEACFESKDNPVNSVELNGTRYLNKGKSPKTVVTSLGKITIRRSYTQK